MFGLIPFENMIMDNANSSLSDIFDTFFNDDLTKMFNMEESIKTEIKEKDDSYLLKAELPGVNKEDLQLDYNDGYLTISAVQNTNFENKNDNYFGQERCYKQVSKSFYFDNVDKEKIQAKFQDEILGVILLTSFLGKITPNISSWNLGVIFTYFFLR